MPQRFFSLFILIYNQYKGSDTVCE
jgi:hypothetical protein